MAKKKAKTIKCPHCGLEGKKPGHPAHCLMKPRGDGEQEKPPDESVQANEDVAAESATTAANTTVASEPAVEQKPPAPAPAPGGPVKMCHKCSRYPVTQLNVVDWHCPSCGDYELRTIKK